MRVPLAFAALALLLASTPPVLATCATTTAGSACVERVDSDLDHLSVLVLQSPGPAGGGYVCGYTGASALVGLSSQDADAFAHSCAFHSDDATGSTFSCWSLYAIDDVRSSCSEAWNDNGVLGRSGVSFSPSLVCVETSGVEVCAQLS